MNRFAFPAILEHDEEGRVVVSFPDFPFAHTDGATLDEALREAVDCLDAAIYFTMKDGGDIPQPTLSGENNRFLHPSAHITAKAALYITWKESGMTRDEMAIRIGASAIETRRLLDPGRSSSIQTIERALRAMGRNLVIDVLKVA